jgi:acetyl esterase/lipase
VPATLEEERAQFADILTRPLPEGVRATDRELGSRPALVLEDPQVAPQGVALYLHGGGYVVGSAHTHASLAARFARAASLRSFVLDYRLAPEHPFPAPVEDSLAAYRQLLEEGWLAEEIVIAGDSAGGGLTVATMIAARDAGLPQPAAAAVFSPWVDLTLSGRSMTSRASDDPIFTREAIDRYAARYLRSEQERRAPLASPMFADLTGLAPMVVQVGSNELLLDDAVRLAERAVDAGVEVTLQVWAGLPHVFQNSVGLIDEADHALEEAARFVGRHLREFLPARGA